VQAPVEDEHGGLAVEVVADRATPQREVLVAVEAHDRREVEAPLEPRLDLVDAAALDVERMLTRQDPQMIVDRLGDHPGGGALARPLVGERPHDQEHRGRRRDRDEVPRPAPPEARRGRRRARPLRGQPALQGHRRSVLGEPALERLAQERLRRRLVRARGARLQVRLQRRVRLRGEPAALGVQEPVPGFLAGHRA